MSREDQADNTNIAVIGAGISGLAAAYSLQEAVKKDHQNTHIHLIEADRRFGGKIITESVDGFTIEGGPDCFLRQKPWAARLAAQVGLQDELIGTNDEKRKTYVVNRGRLVPLPDGVMLIIPTRIMPFALSPLISIPGKLRMGMDLFIPSFQGDSDETVADFIRRRLGQEALDKIADPLLSGIHVSDPESQSLLASFPRFRALEQNHGSMIAGMLKQKRKPARKIEENGDGPQSMFLSMRNGLGQLVDGLAGSLQNVNLISGQQVTKIEKLPQDRFRLTLSGGESIEVDAVILAIPARDAGNLVRETSPRLAAELDQIRFLSTATVSLAFRKSEIKKSFTGFGFVIPHKEQRDITACTWTSIKFDHRAAGEDVLLRCFVGGPNKEEMVSLEDGEMVEVVRRELRSLMGLDASPVFSRIYRWEKSHPQYDVGHLDLIQTIKQEYQKIPGLYLAGSSYEGVGIPDCIRQGQQAAGSLLDYIHQKKSMILN